MTRPWGALAGFKEKPRLPKGTGLEFDNGETLEVSCLTITLTLQRRIRFRGVRLTGFALPFQISDCLAVAVPNSYPKPDLLWDNVIAGPWGWPRSTVLAQVPARRSPMRRVGMHTECASRRFLSTNSLYVGSGQFDKWSERVEAKCG